MDILTANDRVGEYPPSWYAATANPLAPFPQAKGALSCDVCIIGAGYTGLSAALHLTEKGYDVFLLDAHRVGFGASGRNGGQVGTGQRQDQTVLETMLGPELAQELWQLGLDAVALVRHLIDSHSMDCGFSAGIIHADHRRRFVADSWAYAEKLRTEYGYDKIHPLSEADIRHLIGSAAYYGGTLDLGGGHIHPLRFAFGLAQLAAAKGVRIFERSRVTALTSGAAVQIRTEQAEIKAGYAILACNGYLGNLDKTIAARVMPINNFIIATEPLSETAAEALIRHNYAVADSKFVINYFRLSADRRLLFGGGETYSYRFPSDIAAFVRKPLLQIYPQLRTTRIDYAWGGTLGITMNRMPHFTRVQGNILNLSGYSGHGVALATLGGKLAAQAIAGQAEQFDLMAQVPTRRFPGGTALRWPLLVLAMVWFSLRDRL